MPRNNATAGDGFERYVLQSAAVSPWVHIVRAHDPLQPTRSLGGGRFVCVPTRPTWVDFHGHVVRGPGQARSIALETKTTRGSRSGRRFEIDGRLARHQGAFLRQAHADGCIAGVMIRRRATERHRALDFLVPIAALDVLRNGGPSVLWADLMPWRIAPRDDWTELLARRWDAAVASMEGWHPD